MQAQAVEDRELREGVRAAAAGAVHQVVVDAAGRRGLREHVVRGRRGRHAREVPIEHAELVSQSVLDRQLRGVEEPAALAGGAAQLAVGARPDIALVFSAVRVARWVRVRGYFRTPDLIVAPGGIAANVLSSTCSTRREVFMRHSWRR